MGDWLEIAAKVLAYGAVLLTFGCAVTRLVLLPRVASPGTAAWDAATRRVAGVQVAGASVLLIALLFRAFGHTVSAFELPDALSLENLRVIALESRWGEAWRQQVLASVLLFGCCLWTWLERRTVAAGSVAVLSIAVCVELARMGHAATLPWGWLLHGAHMAAAGAWAGAIAAMLLLSSPATRTLRPALLEAFAPVAMVSVAVVAVTGSVAAWHYIGAWSNLVSTRYGITLVIKVAMVADMLVLGGLNWKRLRSQGVSAVPATVWAELLTAIGVVLITAVLTETEHP
jgi:putative copper export protein